LPDRSTQAPNALLVNGIFTGPELFFDNCLPTIPPTVAKVGVFMLVVEDLMLDTEKYRAFRADKHLKLNPTNIDILALLMARSPEIVSKAEIAAKLWGEEGLEKSTGLGTRVHQIRKVVDDGFDFPLVHTVYGVGYQLRK
jgi:DNA-binding winged helix-turn-helix (wHTH) protein